jgi:DNA replication protein DnaC
VLILDELGDVPCNARAADLLFHIITKRHEQRSVVITTTHLAFKAWTTIFRDAACLSRLIDRFAEHCHDIDIDIDIDIDSYRDKSSLRNKRQRTARKTKS